MNITLEEARELYKQGAAAKKIALRAYTEEEILNDYTIITRLIPCEITDVSKTYAQLYATYKRMSKGREVLLRHGKYYIPRIILNNGPNFSIVECAKQRVKINNESFKIYTTVEANNWEGRLGFENDGVSNGEELFSNQWIFRDKEQAQHFVTHFYRELIMVSLGDMYKIEFEELV